MDFHSLCSSHIGVIWIHKCAMCSFSLLNIQGPFHPSSQPKSYVSLRSQCTVASLGKPVSSWTRSDPSMIHPGLKSLITLTIHKLRDYLFYILPLLLMGCNYPNASVPSYVLVSATHYHKGIKCRFKYASLMCDLKSQSLTLCYTRAVQRLVLLLEVMGSEGATQVCHGHCCFSRTDTVPRSQKALSKYSLHG